MFLSYSSSIDRSDPPCALSLTVYPSCPIDRLLPSATFRLKRSVVQRWYLRSILEQLITINMEVCQNRISKRGSNRHVCSVSPGGHQHPPDSRSVVTSVYCHPMSIEKYLIPRTEISRSTIRRTNIPEISRCVPSRNILATRQGNRQMLIVPADSDTFQENIHRRLRGPRHLIVERYLLVHPIPNRSGSFPSGRDLTKKIVCYRSKQINFTVT